MTHQFKIGQVWASRANGHYTITNVDYTGYFPVQALHDGDKAFTSFHANGHNEYHDIKKDLVTLIHERRYCSIIAKNLDDILATANRHIKNINLTHLDLIDNEDGTATDTFYINMFRDTWSDLRDDILEMKRNEA